MVRAIEAYQRAVAGRPSPCRFFPSCSEYGHEAIRVHGAGRGAWLTTRRLLRCRPFGPSGFDPVPLPAGPIARGPIPGSTPGSPATRAHPFEEC